jgi:hypothetical protein
MRKMRNKKDRKREREAHNDEKMDGEVCCMDAAVYVW